MTQEQALNILKTGANIFLTGEPGAGKTHTINRYVSYLRDYGIEPSITASTGIAATHINGMTIHSWSGIGIKKSFTSRELDFIAGNKYIERRIKKSKILIIDEISMLDSKTLDAVDAICRRVKNKMNLPFGGIQTILVGDFFQLPPVAREGETADFAFTSKAWREMNPATCYLSEQHRQEDRAFLSVLSAIRSDSFDSEHYAHIEHRMAGQQEPSKNITKLFPHNADVDRINDVELRKISETEHCFDMRSTGQKNIVETLKRGCLSPEKLILKKGAVVIFTKNNIKEHFVNGTLGKVIGFDNETGYPIVKTTKGNVIEVAPMEWTVEEHGWVRAKIVQIPLKLAWAITVHKSQGMSLDAALMDLSKVFEFGQGYVALSRVRSLDGLHLLGINEHALLVHPGILEIDKDFRNNSAATIDLFNITDRNELLRQFEAFIGKCGGRKLTETEKNEKNDKKKKEKISTHEVTLEIFQKGKGISAIAKERGLTEGTILSHIEALISRDRIKPSEFEKYIEPRLKKELPVIMREFEKLDTDKLSLVREAFGEKYSYDDLRVARMMME